MSLDNGFEFPVKAILRINHSVTRSMKTSMDGLGNVKTVMDGGIVSKNEPEVSTIRVQYNPSSLSISATANEVEVEQEIRPGLGSAKKQKKQPASVTLTVQLIFDAVNVKDAFGLEKFRVSAGDAGNAAAAIDKMGTGGYSVRTQMEGLLGMISDTANSGVDFIWQDLHFQGQVTRMQSSYTMFSVSGEPIRGTVNMTISQKLGSGGQKYWDNAFVRCFE